MQVVTRKKGRPSKAEQLQIQETLRPFFERGTRATKVAEITGHDVKTVGKYFNKWYDEIAMYEKQNFEERHQQARQRFALVLENLIDESYDMLDKVKQLINESTQQKHTIPAYLIKSHSEIIRNISDLVEKRTLVLMEPGIEKLVDSIVEGRFAKYVQSKQSQ